MANPPRKKGTAYENKVLAQLKPVWPKADRAKAGNVSCDIINVPFPVECKHRHVWAIKEWVRNIRKVAPDGRWALFVADGDQRSKESAGQVVILPTAFALELFEMWGTGVLVLREGDK